MIHKEEMKRTAYGTVSMQLNFPSPGNYKPSILFGFSMFNEGKSVSKENHFTKIDELITGTNDIF